MAIDEVLRKKRLDTCIAHMTAENAHRFDECMALFKRPRYDVIPTSEVYDGTKELGGLMQENLTAFPDFKYDYHHVYEADDAIIVDGTFHGTHLGVWRGLPGTGRKVAFAMLLIFPFEGEGMMGEKVFFDLNTVLIQLGVGRDPNSLSGKFFTLLTHPLTFLLAILRTIFGRNR